MELDLSVRPGGIYDLVHVEEVGGRYTITDEPQVAANRVGRRIAAWIKDIPPEEREEVVLTGGAPIWVYLVAMHLVVHVFHRVLYKDARGQVVVVAMH